MDHQRVQEFLGRFVDRRDENTAVGVDALNISNARVKPTQIKALSDARVFQRPLRERHILVDIALCVDAFFCRYQLGSVDIHDIKPVW